MKRLCTAACIIMQLVRVCHGQIEFSKYSSAPGEAIGITIPPVDKFSYAGFSVTFNQVAADIISVTDNVIKVMVPGVSAGSKQVTVYYAERVVGKRLFTVLDYPTIKVIFGMKDGNFEKIGQKFTNEKPDTAQVSLSSPFMYQIIQSRDAKIISLGSVPVTHAGNEVFINFAGQITRDTVSNLATFDIIIPNTRNNLNIRFFENKYPGRFDPAAVKRNKMLREIKIK